MFDYLQKYFTSFIIFRESRQLVLPFFTAQKMDSICQSFSNLDTITECSEAGDRSGILNQSVPREAFNPDVHDEVQTLDFAALEQIQASPPRTSERTVFEETQASITREMTASDNTQISASSKMDMSIFNQTFDNPPRPSLASFLEAEMDAFSSDPCKSESFADLIKESSSVIVSFV